MSFPCCAPTRERARILEASTAASAERIRVTSGSTEDMIRLESARFLMGSEDADGFPADGEGPVRAVTLDSFYLDRYPVTNEKFAEFVQATDYKTEAERFGWSFVFHLHLEDYKGLEHPPGLPWWRKVKGAYWGSDIKGKEHYPVTQVSWNDAQAYAKWAGKRLPTEAEWEYAARGGLEQKRFPWGDELTPGGRHLCNIWQGEFPERDTGEDGYTGPAPVDAYPANGYGFGTITGNVWEWCADWFSSDYHAFATRLNPVGPAQGRGKIIRGGSFLCHASYCNRYRNAARSANSVDSATSNMGFRCARD